MKAKHTPGPWAIKQSVTGGPPGGLFLVTADGAEIAEVIGLKNAVLVSSAPDLLEALQDCRRALLNAGATGELAVVDAAIKKATGATP